jgi:hypothetical protein
MVLSLLALTGASAAPPLDVTAPYLLEVRTVTSSDVPFAGQKEMVTTSLFAVRFERDGEGWVQVQTPCSVSVSGGRVSFPDAFVASMKPTRAPVEWRDGAYRHDPGPVFVGVRPGTETLPESPTDPGVVDHEGDGFPGATVHLQVPVFGRVRLALLQVSHTPLSGTISDGRVEGPLEVERLEQRTLGASVAVFDVSRDMTVVPGRSTFRLVPDRAHRCTPDTSSDQPR